MASQDDVQPSNNQLVAAYFDSCIEPTDKFTKKWPVAPSHVIAYWTVD